MNEIIDAIDFCEKDALVSALVHKLNAHSNVLSDFLTKLSIIDGRMAKIEEALHPIVAQAVVAQAVVDHPAAAQQPS